MGSGPLVGTFTDGDGFDWSISGTFDLSGTPVGVGTEFRDVDRIADDLFNLGIGPVGSYLDDAYPGTGVGSSAQAGLQFFNINDSPQNWTTAEGGREINFAAQTLRGSGTNGTTPIAGISATRSIYVPPSASGEGWIRFFDSFTNATGSSQTFLVFLGGQLNNLNSQTYQQLSTSSGDTGWTTADRWVVLDDASNPGANNRDNDPLLLVYGDGTLAPTFVGRTIPPGSSGPAGLYVNTFFQLTLAPGETRSILHYAAQNATNADAVSQEVPVLSAPGVAQLAGLSAAEIATIANYTLSANTAPTLAGFGPNVAYTEQAAAVILDSDVAFADAEGNFTAGTLVVSGVAAGDTVAVANQGNGAGQVGVAGATLSFGGTAIGTIAGGVGASLTITFNAAATSAAVDAVIQRLTYANSSDTPPASRALTVTVTDAGGLSVAGGITVNITAVDDAPVAVPNSFTLPSNAIATLTLEANDTDVDGGPIEVIAINGVTPVIGTLILLPSGAQVRLNGNGSFTYIPTGPFNRLVSEETAAATGAVNTQASDSFTYTLNGGSTATVSVTVTGVDGNGDRLEGNAGNNTITGTGAADFIDLSQGGVDSASGGEGNDSFLFGAAFTGADSVNGGNGTNDQLGLEGNYSGGNALTLGAAQVTGVEAIALLGNNDYSITTLDNLVGAGQELTLYAGAQTGGSFSFNGSAETNGAFRIFGGAGTETLTTGAGNDSIYFGPGTFTTAGTTINAGGGTNDQVALDGDYTVTLTSQQLSGVEVLALLRGTTADLADYNITFADSAATTGQTFTVYAVPVETALVINASLEADAAYRIFGGTGSDTITGGGGADWLWGNTGNDTLRGNGGADRFHFTGATGAGNIDTIADFTTAQGDRIELVGSAFGLGGGSLAASAFVIGTAATTAAHRIIYNSATGGLFYDADGNGAGAAIQFATLTGAPALAATDFVIV